MSENEIPHYDGKDFLAEFIGGEKRKIHIRLHRKDEAEKFLFDWLDNETELFQLIDKPEDFDPEELTDASYNDLLVEIKELNFTVARARHRAKVARAEKWGNGLSVIVKSFEPILRKYLPQLSSIAALTQPDSTPSHGRGSSTSSSGVPQTSKKQNGVSPDDPNLSPAQHAAAMRADREG